MEEQAEPAAPPRFAVVVPTYNNARTLPGVLEALGELACPMIVVNDGSTDGTDRLLARWHDADTSGRLLVTHPANRGKARALQSGFACALEHGYTHAVTIDSDGQLDPGDVPAMIEAARAHPRCMVVGVRRYDLTDYPAKNRLGRVLSNLAVKLECGVRLSDTQCGFRVYPLALFDSVRCVYGRYAFETEVLTRAVWAGAGVVQVPVRCRYTIPEADRVTHFRPWLDTLQGLRLHARLLLRAVTPIRHARAWPDIRTPMDGQVDGRTLWRRLLSWLNPLRAWRELRLGRLDRGELAVGLAVGVFIGVLPVYGLHTLMCLYTAARLHLNPHVTVAGSAVLATPPQGVLLIALSIVTGQFILHGHVIPLSQLDLAGLSWLQIAGRFYLEWAVGSLVVGVVCALVAGLAGYGLFGVIQPGERPGVGSEGPEADGVVHADSL